MVQIIYVLFMICVVRLCFVRTKYQSKNSKGGYQERASAKLTAIDQRHFVRKSKKIFLPNGESNPDLPRFASEVTSGNHNR